MTDRNTLIVLSEGFQKIFKYNSTYINTPDPTRIKDNGKMEADNRYIQNNSINNVQDHFTTNKHLTPVPIIEGRLCNWGAIDIDTYKMNYEDIIRIVNKANFAHLIPAYSKSKGLHLYAFASELVEAKMMRARLNKFKLDNKLDPKTEIFPKQDHLDEGDIGNGITIPYRSFFVKDNPFKHCVGLYTEASDPKTIKEMSPGVFISTAERYSRGLGVHYHNTFAKYLDSQTYQEAENEALDHSISDPKLKKLTSKELIEKIAKNKMNINDESYFDDTITLAIGKMVGSLKSDEDIISDILDNIKHDTGVDTQFYKDKIKRARTKLDIADPDIVFAKLPREIIYIKKNCTFWDTNTNDEYDKETINFVYGKFKKALDRRGAKSVTGYLQQHPKRLIVEDYIYKPQLYKEGECITQVGNKKYINTYKPTSLQAVKGDTSLWDKLLNHIFQDQTQYKEHFLDWIAFIVQNPGVKIRYAIVIVSTMFQVGKGSIFRCIRECLGKQNCKAITVGEALDKSKGYLTDKQLVLIDEMKSEGNYSEKEQLLNHLKIIITEGEVGSRKLYQDYKTIETDTNYLLFTNNIDALSLPQNEERYWVYINKGERLSQQFYKDYHTWIDNGGAEAVLYELKERIISDDFDPKGTAPKTPFLNEMSGAGAHPLTQIFKTYYDEMTFPFEEDRDIVSSSDLFDWFKEEKLLGRARINDVVKALEVLGARPLGQCRVLWGGKTIKPSLYIIRNHRKYENLSTQEIAKKYDKVKFANKNNYENKNN